MKKILFLSLSVLYVLSINGMSSEEMVEKTCGKTLTLDAQVENINALPQEEIAGLSDDFKRRFSDRIKKEQKKLETKRCKSIGGISVACSMFLAGFGNFMCQTYAQDTQCFSTGCSAGFVWGSMLLGVPSICTFSESRKKSALYAKALEKFSQATLANVVVDGSGS